MTQRLAVAEMITVVGTVAAEAAVFITVLRLLDLSIVPWADFHSASLPLPPHQLSIYATDSHPV